MRSQLNLALGTQHYFLLPKLGTFCYLPLGVYVRDSVRLKYDL